MTAPPPWSVRQFTPNRRFHGIDLGRVLTARRRPGAPSPSQGSEVDTVALLIRSRTETNVSAQALVFLPLGEDRFPTPALHINLVLHKNHPGLHKNLW